MFGKNKDKELEMMMRRAEMEDVREQYNNGQQPVTQPIQTQPTQLIEQKPPEQKPEKNIKKETPRFLQAVAQSEKDALLTDWGEIVESDNIEINNNGFVDIDLETFKLSIPKKRVLCIKKGLVQKQLTNTVNL